MLVIFDVDGTLLGGESHDWAAFDQAIATVLGFTPTVDFFNSLPEITAQAIAEAAVCASGGAAGSGLERRICDEYLRRLEEVHAKAPLAFRPRDGVVSLLKHLPSVPGLSVAIATGDWLTSISFKLRVAGLDVSAFPIATSSEVRRRSEIIKLAAQRSGRSLSDAIYVGDGVWDFRACSELGLPFIGTGDRAHRLREAGAEHIVETLEIEPFMTAVRAALRPDIVKGNGEEHPR